MRDYAKVSPAFWTGETGKDLRRRGLEGVVVALYLMSSPHSNMLGLFYQPALYMAHETGLGIEGASKGLRSCIEVGFCEYDEPTEMVWVPEMAAYQIGDSLTSGDKRCKGIQKDYESLPNNPFLMAFFERYKAAFHLSRLHPAAAQKQDKKQGPSKPVTKPHRSQEQEQEQEQEQDLSGAIAPAAVAAEPKPLTPKDRVWLLGVPLLGEKSRALLGKLAKAHGDAVLAEVLAEATADPPVGDAKAWVVAACEVRAKAKPRNGHGYSPTETAESLLQRDAHPQWATYAGFPSLWEAETAGCGPGNFRKFANGKRVEQ